MVFNTKTVIHDRLDDLGVTTIVGNVFVPCFFHLNFHLQCPTSPELPRPRGPFFRCRASATASGAARQDGSNSASIAFPVVSGTRRAPGCPCRWLFGRGYHGKSGNSMVIVDYGNWMVIGWCNWMVMSGNCMIMYGNVSYI